MLYSPDLVVFIVAIVVFSLIFAVVRIELIVSKGDFALFVANVDRG